MGNLQREGDVTKEQILTCFAVSLGITGATATTALASWVSTSWANIDITQEACLARAEKAISSSGFSPKQKLVQSRFGVVDDYTVVVRCISDKSMVFFVVAGPKSDVVDKYLTALEGGFK